MDWSRLLDDFGTRLLVELGESPYYLPTDYNPITRALEDDDFVEKFRHIKGFNRVALSRVATICQMVVYDAQDGPERDGVLQSLRRHWYSWYKLHFAQPFAFQLGDTTMNAQGIEEVNDIAWTQRLSQTYAEFVDQHGVTYKDLWVEDASRMMESVYDTLFRGCNIIVAVEKDSLFKSFQRAAASLGAKSLYSGKGKSSKAAIERLLREHFSWRGDGPWENPFSAEKPLIILHVSDWDYDGEKVIGPTFGEQARRYTEHVLEARVGIVPHQVTDAGQAQEDCWYIVKVSNQGYVEWAEHKALYLATCINCGHRWPVVGVLTGEGAWRMEHVCPECDGDAAMIEIGADTPHGFEVEAMETRQYRRLLVDALLQVLDFDYIVGKLRDECQADNWSAAQAIADMVCKQSDAYQKILQELERFEALRKAKERFEDAVRDHFYRVGEKHKDDWRDEEDDPTPDDFKEHVEEASGSVWRPFSHQLRTENLIDFLEVEYDEDMQEFIYQDIEVEEAD